MTSETVTDMSGKTLPSAFPTNRCPAKTNGKKVVAAATLVLWALLWFVYYQPWPLGRAGYSSAGSGDVCPQTPELVPDKNRELWEHIGAIFDTESFKGRAVDWLGGAVRVS
jgi:hypothetical protein